MFRPPPGGGPPGARKQTEEGKGRGGLGDRSHPSQISKAKVTNDKKANSGYLVSSCSGWGSSFSAVWPVAPAVLPCLVVEEAPLLVLLLF